jgi:hypothetical protein
VLDDEGRSAAKSRPPDPDWEPDLVVLDEPPDPHAEVPLAPGDVAEGYASWLHRFSARSARGGSPWQSRRSQAIGMMILLAVIAANLWLCWAVRDHDAQDEVHQAETSSSRVK